MKIVVLDGYVLDPGDNPWHDLHELGDLTVYDRISTEKFLEAARSAEIILTNKVRFTAERINALPKLRYLGVLATGYDVVDLAAANERGIVVTNVPDYATDAVAEHVFALLFGLFRHVEAHDASVRAGHWGQCKDWCYWTHTQLELSGKTMGIIGFGHIGRRVAELARAFNMPVLAYAPRPAQGLDPTSGKPFAFAELDEVFFHADVVSLHCPLTPGTKGMVNARRLDSMRKGGWLINTSRGGLVDDQAVADALKSGHLAGAGLDVVSREPMAPDNPLLGAPNCLITPHIAWATLGARRRLTRIATANVAAFLNKKPINVVNKIKS